MRAIMFACATLSIGFWTGAMCSQTGPAPTWILVVFPPLIIAELVALWLTPPDGS